MVAVEKPAFSVASTTRPPIPEQQSDIDIVQSQVEKSAENNAMDTVEKPASSMASTTGPPKPQNQSDIVQSMLDTVERPVEKYAEVAVEKPAYSMASTTRPPEPEQQSDIFESKSNAIEKSVGKDAEVAVEKPASSAASANPSKPEQLSGIVQPKSNTETVEKDVEVAVEKPASSAASTTRPSKPDQLSDIVQSKSNTMEKSVEKNAEVAVEKPASSAASTARPSEPEQLPGIVQSKSIAMEKSVEKYAEVAVEKSASSAASTTRPPKPEQLPGIVQPKSNVKSVEKDAEVVVEKPASSAESTTRSPKPEQLPGIVEFKSNTIEKSVEKDAKVVASSIASNKPHEPEQLSDIVHIELTEAIKEAAFSSNIGSAPVSRPMTEEATPIIDFGSSSSSNILTVSRGLVPATTTTASVPFTSSAPLVVRDKTSIAKAGGSESATSKRQNVMLQTQRRQEQARHAELLRQRHIEKVEEAQRLLKEADRLKEVAETLDKLRQLPQKAEALRRTQAAQQDEVAKLQRQIERATRKQQSAQQRQSFSGHADFSSGPAPSYYSPTPASVVSPSKSRHKNNSMIKRRPRNGHFDINDTAIDVESQSKNISISENRTHGRFGANRDAIDSDNPLVMVRLLLRKITLDVLTDEDDEALGSDETDANILIITLLIEAIVGILLAFAALTCSLFIYNIFVPNLPTAQNFKRVAFVLMNDTQTLKDFEADRGLKFMDMDQYVSIVAEIEEATSKIKTAKSTLKSRSEHVAEMEMEMEIEQYATKIPEFISALQLDYFCGECVWSVPERLTCDMRVMALKKTYRTPKYEAMVSAMQKKSCKKTEEQFKEAKELQAKIDVILLDWKVNQKDFCPECEWDVGASCQSRIEYVVENHGLELDLATAQLMVKSKQCTRSHRNKDKKNPELTSLQLDYFCRDCMWSVSLGLTCSMRVKALKDTYNTPHNQAILSAMEKEVCIKSHQQVKKEKEIKAKVDKLLRDWEMNQKDFCPDCDWDLGKSCQSRMEYVVENHGVELNVATANLMIKSRQCTHSYRKKYRENTKSISSMQKDRGNRESISLVQKDRENAQSISSMLKDQENTESIPSEMLDYFCGECMWSVFQKVTCSMRVNALKKRYNTPHIEAMRSAMEKEVCNKSDQLVREEKELQAKVDVLFQNWEGNLEDFCPECEWKGDMTCQSRREYLHTMHKVEGKTSTAHLMIQSPQCLYSHNVEDNEKVARFCSDCEWGLGSSCSDRVKFLIAQYDSSERMAMLSAMDKPSCMAAPNE